MKPMLVSMGSVKDLDRTDVLFEPKLDGIRALCFVTQTLRFVSRNGIDITQDYPEFQFRDLITATDALLDGEIVVYDEDLTPRFELWQQGYEATYVVFDILSFNGTSLLNEPLSKRKELLERVVTDGPHLEKCLYTTDGHALWQTMMKRGMEGIIAKERTSVYRPGTRSHAWRKIKALKTLEALIIGYTTKKRALSSLLLGIYKEGQLVYVGRVGTGFSEQAIDQLLTKLQPLIRKTPYDPSFRSLKGTITWVRPTLVAEIKYQEITQKGRLRLPVFMRLRYDKDPEEITFEKQELRV